MTIGAVPLSELAKELELSGKAADYDPILQKTDLLLEQYEEVLKAALDFLISHDIVMDDTTEQTTDLSELNTEIDRAVVNKYCEFFREALSEFDVDKAEELYSKTKEEGKAYEEIFRKIMELIRNFEYDKAEEEIERMINE